MLAGLLNRSAMNDTEPTATVQQLNRGLMRLDRRDWSLWATAVAVLLLIWLAAYSVSIGVRGSEQQPQVVNGLRGLFVLILLFALFVVYQQRLIKQLRHKLHAQMTALVELNTRAETFDRLPVLDELTGLFNRRFAIEHLARELVRCELSETSLIVALIDLDEFRKINEAYGRKAGDTILQEFSNHIRKAIRSSDLPVRLEDDKFLLILSDCSADDVHRPLHRLKGCDVTYTGVRIQVTFCAAWVSSRPGELAGELLGRVEQAIAQEKYSQSRMSPST
jgi:diguanylate cyclase (GGDEF)-like protein